MYDADNQSETKAQALSGMAGVYDEFGEPKKGREYLDQALKIYKANNDLPGQASTLASIALNYQNLELVSPKDSLQALDFDANYNWVTNPQLSQYRIIHFATHGFADNINPELSGIVLSLIDKQGKPIRGYLRLNDIFNLELPADLVVLSACNTGRGKQVQGEGLVGLTRGLMYAGSQRVVVSLWSVNDEGTKELMSEFYRQMLQQGKSPTAALRAAQLYLWQQKEWKDPYFWAAFTVQGEWQNNS